MALTVGQKFSRTDGPVTREGIIEYAKASGDQNPIHVNEEFATTRGGLNGVIAHGMLFFGYALHLLSDIAEENKGKLLAVDCQMRGSVRPGDWVITEVEVKAVNGNVADIEINQYSKMPLKLEKGGAVVKKFEGEERQWVKDKEATGIASEDTPDGKLTFRKWISIIATGKIEFN
jgi:acyl dehydratase